MLVYNAVDAVSVFLFTSILAHKRRNEEDKIRHSAIIVHDSQ